MAEPASANTAEWKSTACILCECNCGIVVQTEEIGRASCRERVSSPV